MFVKMYRCIVAEVEKSLQCILGRHMFCDAHSLTSRCQTETNSFSETNQQFLFDTSSTGNRLTVKAVAH